MIAFDASALGAVSTATWTHVCSGINRILFVLVFSGDGNSVSAATYNGVSMTSLSTFSASGGTATVFYLINPATGSHTVSITTASATYRGASASYTGMKQSGVPDAVNTTSGGINLASITNVVAVNCWVIGLAGVHQTGVGSNPVSFSNKTDRQTGVIDANNSMCIFDTNGPVAKGNYTIIVDNSAGVATNFAITFSITMPDAGGFFLKML